MAGQINPNSPVVQILVVTLICLIPFGDYYSMDSPGAMEFYVKESTTNMKGERPLSQTEFNNLYFVYSMPNVVLCIVAGYFMDAYLGRRKGTLLFGAIVTFGQFVVTAGSFFDSLILMYIGRFVFGIGAESLALGEYAYNIHWFDRTKLKEGDPYKPIIGLSTAFGIAISISRGATFFAFQTLGPIYKWVAGVNATATMEAIESERMSWNEGSNVTVEGESTVKEVYNLSNQATAAAFAAAGCLALLCLIMSGFLGMIDIRTSRWRKRNALNEDEGGTMIKTSEDTEETPAKVSLRDITKIPLQAWLIFAICGLYYMAVFPFVSTGVEYLKIYHGAEHDAAKFWAPLIVVFSGMGLALTFGFLIDWLKYNTLWLLAGIGLTGVGHFFLTFMKFVPFQVDILLMGTGYALVASSLWPMLAYNISPNLVSTGYGLMQSIQSLCLMTAYWVAGTIMDSAVNSLTAFKKTQCGDGFLVTCDDLDMDDIKETGQLNGYYQVGMFYVGSTVLAAVCTVGLALKVGVHGGADKASKEDTGIPTAMTDGSYLSLTGAMAMTRRPSI